MKSNPPLTIEEIEDVSHFVYYGEPPQDGFDITKLPTWVSPSSEYWVRYGESELVNSDLYVPDARQGMAYVCEWVRQGGRVYEHNPLDHPPTERVK